jgi:hypothetical protein
MGMRDQLIIKDDCLWLKFEQCAWALPSTFKTGREHRMLPLEFCATVPHTPVYPIGELNFDFVYGPERAQAACLRHRTYKKAAAANPIVTYTRPAQAELNTLFESVSEEIAAFWPDVMACSFEHPSLRWYCLRTSDGTLIGIVHAWYETDVLFIPCRMVHNKYRDWSRWFLWQVFDAAAKEHATAINDGEALWYPGHLQFKGGLDPVRFQSYFALVNTWRILFPVWF